MSALSQTLIPKLVASPCPSLTPTLTALLLTLAVYPNLVQIRPKPVAGQEVYGQLYSQENVAISGIHTHSGPAGYLQYLLYDIPARGFVHETFNVLVNGIVSVRLRSIANVCMGIPVPLSLFCTRAITREEIAGPSQVPD